MRKRFQIVVGCAILPLMAIEPVLACCFGPAGCTGAQTFTCRNCPNTTPSGTPLFSNCPSTPLSSQCYIMDQLAGYLGCNFLADDPCGDPFYDCGWTETVAFGYCQGTAKSWAVRACCRLPT